MIVSASRRTDIPALYPEWLLNRLRAGFALVRDPFNARRLRRVDLTPEGAQAFVFWTRNAGSLLPPERFQRGNSRAAPSRSPAFSFRSRVEPPSPSSPRPQL